MFNLLSGIFANSGRVIVFPAASAIETASFSPPPRICNPYNLPVKVEDLVKKETLECSFKYKIENGTFNKSYWNALQFIIGR